MGFKKKPFRIYSNSFHLIYKTHLDKEAWIKWADKEFSKIKKAYLKNAIGETGYKYTLVLVEFEEKIESENSSIFDFFVENDMIHPHITFIKNTIHWDNCVNHHKKLEVLDPMDRLFYLHNSSRTVFSNII